ncbi:replication protein [Thioclava sp. SK-1]|uniref:ParB/RepB/Spo0J family partition protein n=1 Tax=Thioclava sp. SK-1 TaxID=1889770 RepID=UPI000824A726|nr:ParB N-terminal domain-containing protein [Thioclava sp. SK-1]OCX62245.1 replication protein [Thioclava sp. SK-1]
MTKKRRTFAIDLPDEEDSIPAEIDPKPAPSGPAPRRSPMAAAISENAASLRDRKALEERIRVENDALAAEHVRMKKLGLIVDLVPLDKVDTWKLVRDRASGDDIELTELVTSIRELGLSNPIRLEARDDGRYELIQGFRRLSAFKRLLEETGDTDKWGAIPAGILPRGEDLEGLYRRMVDENLVRKDISFGEMATLALNYARDPATAQNDPDKAVAELFASAGYQKRSYIRNFIKLVERLGDDLQFIQHVPRSLGLSLVTALEERPDLALHIRGVLKDLDNRSVTEELNALRDALEDLTVAPPVAKTPAVKRSGKARTVFQVGQAKCTASNGRLEIRMDRDFSTLDRQRLEDALRHMLDGLQ